MQQNLPSTHNLAFFSNVNINLLQMEGGRISLEGTVCEDYYKIRQLLYAQFAII